MKRFKKLITTMLFASLFVSSSAITMASSPSFEPSSAVSQKSIVTPQAVVSKPKEVQRTYRNVDSIPTSITYSEYSDGISWSDTLQLYSITPPVNGIYTATYRGTLLGNS